MAEQLIESLASEFDPTRYHDEYREKVLELIEAKAQGKEVSPGRQGRRRPRSAAPGVAGQRRP